MSLTSDWTYSALLSAFDAGVCNNLVLVVANSRFCDWTNVLRSRLQHIWMVWWENGGCSTNNRTEGVVELLSLGLLHSRLEGGARGGFGGREAWNLGMLVKVVVVVGCCAYDRAL